MNKFLSFLRSYLGHVGAYFMFTMLAFGLFSLSIGETANPLKLGLIFSSLLFAALIGIADYVFRFKFLGAYVAKVAVHGVLTIASFALSFIAVAGLVERGRTALFGVLFFAVFYLVIAVVRCVYHYTTEKKANAKKGYTNLYTPKNLD